MNPARKLIWSLPALFTAGLIFYLSSQEKIELPLDEISFNDLLFHGAGYFVFGVTLLLAAYPWSGFHEKPEGGLLILFLVGMLYALSDEIHQGFVPNRNCSLADFLADSLGVGMALAGGYLLRKKVGKSGSEGVRE